jgi:outer membrane protein assembly factor BamB
MDGTHFVPIAGTPDEFKETAALDSLVAPEGWATSPVALFAPLRFAIASRNGHIFVYNEHDTLNNTIDLASQENIEQLLADTLAIYAISVNGNIYAYTPAGKFLWKGSVDGMLTGSAILSEGLLIVPRGDAIVALDAHTGVILWRRSCIPHVVSLAYNDLSHSILAGLSNYEAGQSDSIAVLDTKGRTVAEFALQSARITSNLCLAGEKKDVLVVGLLTVDASGRRPAVVRAYDYQEGSAKMLWEHNLPYLIMNVAANPDQVFTSGFRTVENELVSGIDAFSIEDTTANWSRRFSEPVASAVAVGNTNLYFTMAFTSEAIVASRGLFYSLRAATGKTETERAFKGANGFVPGMPIPDEMGRLLIADRDRLVVYVVDRSSLKRVF